MMMGHVPGHDMPNSGANEGEAVKGYHVRRRLAAAVEAFRCDPTDELRINGIHAAKFAKRAYDLGDDLQGPGRFDMGDPTQRKLERVRDWIQMARQDALDARREQTKGKRDA